MEGAGYGLRRGLAGLGGAVWGGAFYYQANFDVEIKAGGLCCMELLAVSYKS